MQAIPLFWGISMNLLPEKIVWPSGYAVKAQGKGWRNCGSNSPPTALFFSFFFFLFSYHSDGEDMKVDATRET